MPMDSIRCLVAEIERSSESIQWMVLMDKNKDGFGILAVSESSTKALSNRNTDIAVSITSKGVDEAFLGEVRRLHLYSKKTRVVVLPKDTFQLPLESPFKQNPDTGHWYAPEPNKKECLTWTQVLRQQMMCAALQGSTALECLQIVNVQSLTAIMSCDNSLLQKLPRLRFVTIDLDDFLRHDANATNTVNWSLVTNRMAVLTTEARPITETLPELTKWANRHQSEFSAVWKPLQEKGVRLCLRHAETKEIVLEILLEGQRLMTRSVPPESGFRDDLTASKRTWSGQRCSSIKLL
ncbi:hypothetical protein Brms1b_008151 [Colletotrichum noveboracense]|nr:hypothetical protein Brms1b_008151 [Colletotrichum noveboracense]